MQNNLPELEDPDNDAGAVVESVYAAPNVTAVEGIVKGADIPVETRFWMMSATAVAS